MGNQIITSFRIIKKKTTAWKGRSKYTLILVQTICASNNKFVYSYIHSHGFTGIQDHPLFIHSLVFMWSFNIFKHTPQCSK